MHAVRIREPKVYTLSPVGDETFGGRLARLRNERGLSQTTLAARVERSENWLRRVESGEIAEPSFQVGIKLARSLHVSPEYLATGGGNSTASSEFAEATETKVVSLPGAVGFDDRLQEAEAKIAALQRQMVTALATAEDGLALAQRLQRPAEKGDTRRGAS